MTSTWLIWGCFTVVTLLYVLLTIVGVRSEGWSASIALFGIAAAIGALFIRQSVEEKSMCGAAIGATVLTLAMLVVTRGRPHLLFDIEEFHDGRDPEHQVDPVRRRQTSIAQISIIGFIVVALLMYSVMGWRFLD